MVVFLAHWTAKIREPDGRFHFLQPCERESEFEVQATSNVRPPAQLQRLGTYVSMIEQCQKARRVRSACPEDEALGWLRHVSNVRRSWRGQRYLVMSAWLAMDANVFILQKS